jgi:TonB family protein
MKDYPESARKRREEGITGFLLTVGIDGLVNACQVIKSSGSPRLDMTTCQLAKLRARFEPALDSDGQAVIGYYPGVLTWRLDRLRDAPLPGTVTHTFMVEIDGRVTNCRIVAVTGDARKQFRVGPETCRHTAFDRYVEPVEARKRKRVTEVETIVVSEVPATP